MTELDFDIYTKIDFIELFEQMGIEKGSIVLLQADLSRYTNIVGSYQMLIETLKEYITNQGCLIMPTFSYSCLDPACLDYQQYAYQDWKRVRQNLPGFHVLKSMSEIYQECTNLFLQDKDVYRSNHPVYSFAYWGNFDEKILKMDVNEPISFDSFLKPMKNKKACNLLIGVSPEKSILLQAIANEYQLGQTIVQRAFVHGKRQLTKSFYMSLIDEKLCKDLLDGCQVKALPFFNDFIYKIQ